MQPKDLLSAQLEGKRNTLSFLQELLSSQINPDAYQRLLCAIHELEIAIRALEMQIQNLSDS